MEKRVTSRQNPTSKTETDGYVINNNNDKIPHSMRMARPTDSLRRNESSGGDV